MLPTDWNQALISWELDWINSDNDRGNLVYKGSELSVGLKQEFSNRN